MTPSILRILDANANRAREALRVVEDYARFALDDQALSRKLKAIRHELATIVQIWGDQAILCRDTPGDVGTTNKTPAELSREDLWAVITAAGKRLGEALRTIEEYLKIDHPSQSAAVETMRYAFYDIEMRIARTLRPASRFKDVLLYVLITESICKRPWLDVARAAIAGGADCLQLREKELEGAELLRRARTLAALCKEAGVLFILNDRPDIALLSGADGVHVGQGDLPAAEVRKIVGSAMIVGVSTHNLDQVRQAHLDGADYIGVGPVFRSSTKTRQILPGPEFAKAAAQASPLPTVAIAGITEENLDTVLATGVQAIALTAAIAACEDPQAATRRIKNRIVAQRQRQEGLPHPS